MQLLEHFKELTLHPKNAEELKGLILQLAVQGKLTKQWRMENVDVEPASILLERINEEKERLIKEKKIKKEKPLPEISKEEIAFELPENWGWFRLRDLGYTMTGGTPSKSNPNFFGNHIPFIKPGDIKNWAIDYENEGLTKLGENNLDRTAPKGSVLMVCLGTIGKCAIINRNCCFNQQINSITPLILSSDYLLYCVSSKYFYNTAWEKSTSTTIALLNKSNWESIAIPLPPLEEQKAIVAIVNQLFTEVEQLEALTKERIQLKSDFVTSALKHLTQAPEQDTASHWAFFQQHFGTFFTEKENIKKLREGILQLAVQGKLTRDWRALRQTQGIPIEHASTLLEKIKAEKEQLIKEKKIKKEKSLPEISEEEIPYELPEGWVWCRFQEIFDIRDGTHDSPKDAFGSDTFPLITSKNFNNGEIKFETARRISGEDYSKVIQRSQVHKGDILFSMIGGNIGNQVEVGDFTEFAIKNVALFKHYRFGLPSEGFLKLFSQFIALSLQGEAAGGAQPFVSLKFFRNLIVGLPPTEEQKVIVEKVNALMTLCDKLEQEIENHQTTQEEWMQSCLREVV